MTMPKEYPWREKIMHGKYGIKFVWCRNRKGGCLHRVMFQNPSAQEVIDQRVKLGLGALNPKLKEKP
jgi:hypothetical protein